jgi:hypothetical protein
MSAKDRSINEQKFELERNLLKKLGCKLTLQKLNVFSRFFV